MAVREEIEWMDVWVPGNSNKDLPRVLLIGDSIVRAYYKEGEDRLKGKAVICRLSTAKSLGDPSYLDEVKLVLSQTHYDVVHFNNGLHGFGYTEEEYTSALPELLKVIRTNAPDAKLIWASTTAVRVADKLDTLSSTTERVKKRNANAKKLMDQESILVDDLFGVVISNAEYYSKDGVHMNGKGNSALGAKVAEALLPLLTKKE
jgi:lysophospholipase L1-like esterase